MRKLFTIATVLFAIDISVQAQPASSADYAPGELLIKFRANATDAQLLHALQGGRLKILKHFVLNNLQHPGVTHVSSQLDVPTALRFLRNHPAVEYAEPNYALYPGNTPNDPQFSKQWSLNNT